MVTPWGNDPIWPWAFVPGSNTSVVVAPHDVTYDPERRLWFCDMAVNTGAAYWPFVEPQADARAA